ncbi:MAG: methyltransferase domain-containing protein [Anaerolineales bacterium]|nr:methyltransferase domain-containing protein [Anaerolineales bacterium]
MTTPFSFPRYLAAKKPIDDRALNRHVWDTMTRALSSAYPNAPLRLLEVGCGIGTMYERLLEWNLTKSAHPERSGDSFPSQNIPTPTQSRDAVPFAYTGIDSSPENISTAQKRFALPPAAHHASRIPPHFLLADLYALPPTIASGSFDLLLAHAVLDLLDLSRALPHLLSYLRPGGVFYFTLNFDGETIFQPEHPLDPLILALYHRTMDERLTAPPTGDNDAPGDATPSGDSRTGRHLFAHLKNAGADLLAVGSSDWVVFPSADGYPGDEAYFLHHILHFFEESLTGHPELTEAQLSAWLALRRTQIEQGALIFLAHQLDFAGRVAPSVPVETSTLAV